MSDHAVLFCWTRDRGGVAQAKPCMSFFLTTRAVPLQSGPVAQASRSLRCLQPLAAYRQTLDACATFRYFLLFWKGLALLA
jgi:hypothetical protein